jgi:hypothetical protein
MTEKSIIPLRKTQYEECHQRIAAAVEAGLEDFMRIGVELDRMRTLASAGPHKTFEKYCQAEWGWSADYGRKMIRAARVKPHLPPLPTPEGEARLEVSPLRWTETTIRPLTALDTIDQMTAVAKKVNKAIQTAWKAGETPSLSKLVKEFVAEAKSRKPKPTPEFHEVVKKWTTSLKRMRGFVERLPGDSPQMLAEDHPDIVEDFAEAIRQLEVAWQVTRPAPEARRKFVEDA